MRSIKPERLESCRTKLRVVQKLYGGNAFDWSARWPLMKPRRVGWRAGKQGNLLRIRRLSIPDVFQERECQLPFPLSAFSSTQHCHYPASAFDQKLATLAHSKPIQLSLTLNQQHITFDIQSNQPRLLSPATNQTNRQKRPRCAPPLSP